MKQLRVLLTTILFCLLFSSATFALESPIYMTVNEELTISNADLRAFLGTDDAQTISVTAVNNDDNFVSWDFDTDNNLVLTAIQTGEPVLNIEDASRNHQKTLQIYIVDITLTNSQDSDISLKIGETQTIQYVVHPQTTVGKETWEILDDKIASIEHSVGEKDTIDITAKQVGQTTITGSNHKAQVVINLTVTSDEKITLDPQSIKGINGTKQTVNASVIDAPGNVTLEWSVENPTIAKIGENQNGNSVDVELLSKGNTTLTVKDQNTGVTAVCNIEVTYPVKFTPDKLELSVGEEKDVELDLGGGTETITWSVKDTQIATIASSDGNKAKVKGIKAGETEVIARIGEVDYALPVTVTENEVKFSPESLDLDIGEEQKVELTLGQDNKDTINWTVSDSRIAAVSPDEGNTAIVVGVDTGETTVVAKVGENEYTLPVTVKKNGELTVSPEYLDLNINESKRLEASVTGKPTENNLEWKPLDSTIVTVTPNTDYSANISGLKKGTTAISVSFENDKGVPVSVEIPITVKDPNENINPETYRDRSDSRYGRNPYKLSSSVYDTKELKVPISTKTLNDGSNEFVIAGYIKTSNVFSQEDIAGLDHLNVESESNIPVDRLPDQGAYLTVIDKDGTELAKSELHNETNDWEPFLLPFNSSNFDKNGSELEINAVCHLGSTLKRSYGDAWFDIIGILPIKNGANLPSSNNNMGLLSPRDNDNFYLENHQVNLFTLNGFNTVTNNIKSKVGTSNITSNSLSADTLTSTNPVSSAVEVTGIKSGSDIVAVYSGSNADVMIVNISSDEPALTASPDWIYLDLDKPDFRTQQITIDPFYDEITYESLDPSIAEVSSTGLVTAKGKGTTAIKVSKGSRIINIEVVVSQEDQLINTVETEAEIAEPYNEYIAQYVDSSDGKYLNVEIPGVESIDNIDDLEIMGNITNYSNIDNSLVSGQAVSFAKPSDSIIKDRGDQLPFEIVNFIRAAHKLDPIYENPDYSYTYYAQKAAEYLNDNNTTPISHTAAKNVPGKEDADRGLQNSNLTSRRQTPVSYYPNEMIYAFLIDKGDNNLQTAGHRRWLLNDKCKFMGFGQDKNNSRSDGALYVVDESAGVNSSKVVSFPPAGNFPTEMISEFHDGYFTWSIMFGDMFTIDNPANVTVTISEVGGRSVSLPQVANAGSANSDWFTIVDKNLGSGKGLNLNPASLECGGHPSDMIGKTYTVRVTGLNGASSELNYETKFVSIKDPTIQNYVKANSIIISPNRLNLVQGDFGQLKATIEPSNATSKSATWNSSDPEIVKVDQNGVVQAVKPGNARITASIDGKMSYCEITVDDNLPDSVKFLQGGSNKTINIKEGQSLELATQFDNQSKVSLLTYTSDNEKVATVDSNGLLKAVGPGKCTITVVTENGHRDTLTVNVVGEDEETVDPTGLKISPNPINLKPGQNITVAVDPIPEEAVLDYTSLKYEVSNTEIASVSTRGVVSAIKAGQTTLTVTSGSNLKATVNIVVTEALGNNFVESITISPRGPLNLKTGETATLTATVNGTTTGALKWTSSDRTVASVAPGANNKATVKAISPGTTLIKVETQDGGASNSITVGVTDATGSSNNVDGYHGSGGSTLTLSPGNSTNNSSGTNSTNSSSGSTGSSDNGTNSTTTENYIVRANNTTSTGTVNSTNTTDTDKVNPKTGVNEDIPIISICIIMIFATIVLVVKIRER